MAMMIKRKEGKKMNTIIKFYIRKYIYKKLEEVEKQEKNNTSVNDILYDWVNSSSVEF